MFLYTVLLFVLLTPAILVRLPPKGNKWTVALVHGLIFSTILHLSHRFVLGLTLNIEGARGNRVDANTGAVSPAESGRRARDPAQTGGRGRRAAAASGGSEVREEVRQETRQTARDAYF